MHFNKMKLRLTSKKYVFFVSSIAVIPVIILLFCYSWYLLGVLHVELERAGRDAMLIYQQKLETDLSSVE